MKAKIQEILNNIQDNNLEFSHFNKAIDFSEFEAFHHCIDDLFVPVNNKSNLLSDLSFTVKDVINTYLFPTEMGSNQWEGFKSGNNARCITKLLWEDASFCGKTVTSEFAVHQETNVVNPWNKSRTCGTSSAGAAVNILLNECDFALATQTGGSIGRPASYCGVKAFKPTYGLVSRTGVLKTCDPFDTVGYFVKDFNIASRVSEVLFEVGHNYPLNIQDSTRSIKKIGVLKCHDVVYDSATLSKFKLFLDDLSKDFDVEYFDIPEIYTNVHEKHSIIYSYSLAYYFKNELSDQEQVSESFKETVKYGETFSRDQFVSALEDHDSDVESFSKWMGDNNIDVILSPAVYGVAPEKGGEEKPDMNLFFTYMHLPIAYHPMWMEDQLKMPHGLACAARINDDYNLIGFMKYLEENYQQNEGLGFKDEP